MPSLGYRSLPEALAYMTLNSVKNYPLGFWSSFPLETSSFWPGLTKVDWFRWSNMFLHKSTRVVPGPRRVLTLPGLFYEFPTWRSWLPLLMLWQLLRQLLLLQLGEHCRLKKLVPRVCARGILFLCGLTFHILTLIAMTTHRREKTSLWNNRYTRIWCLTITSQGGIHVSRHWHLEWSSLHRYFILGTLTHRSLRKHDEGSSHDSPHSRLLSGLNDFINRPPCLVELEFMSSITFSMLLRLRSKFMLITGIKLWQSESLLSRMLVLEPKSLFDPHRWC